MADLEAAPLAVQPRETVVFYRGYGFYSPAAQSWNLVICGTIFAPTKKHLRKTLLLQLLKRVVRPEPTREVRQRFLDRAHLFLHDRRPGKSIPIEIAKQAYALPDSTATGEFQTVLTVRESDLAAALQTDSHGRRFVQLCTRLPQEDDRLFSGEIELIPREGISIITDVDDTIKDSNVANRKELLANTFTREFRAVQGMKDVFQSWAQAGCSFHYVSASPWQLYEPLQKWLDDDEFPIGSIHLRHFRLRELRADRKRNHSFQSKRTIIENILRSFPCRRFILCGDSGERDAELYAHIVEAFGPQIARVYIRDMGNLASHNASMYLGANASTQWTFFKSSQELAHDALPHPGSENGMFHRNADILSSE